MSREEAYAAIDQAAARAFAMMTTSHPRLSAAQLQVLRHAQSTMRPLKGHSLTTCASLAKKGLITYESTLMCSTCNQPRRQCHHQGKTHWHVWPRLTPAGVTALEG